MKQFIITVAGLLFLISLPMHSEKIFLKEKKDDPTDQPPPSHEVPVDADCGNKQLHIDFKRPGGFAQINIKDKFGTVLFDVVDTQATHTHVINMGNCTEGAYTLEVEYEDSVVEGEFTVEE